MTNQWGEYDGKTHSVEVKCAQCDGCGWFVTGVQHQRILERETDAAYSAGETWGPGAPGYDEMGQMSDTALTPAERGAMGGGSNAYDTKQVQDALYKMAFFGDAAQASKECDIPAATIRSWVKGKYRGDYEHIRGEIMPQIHAQLAAETEDLARRYAQVESDLLDQFELHRTSLRPNEVGNALQNMAKARAQSTDKALLLRDKPTVRVQHNIEGDLKALQAAGIIDIPDADVIEEES